MKSISHPLAIILQQAIDGKYDQNSLITLLNAADEEIDTYDFTDAPLDVIATCIHQLYLNNSSEIRAVLLRLIVGIENAQHESILETYNLDKLVALSFDHRPSQDSPGGQSQKDEEKYSAFGIVYLLNKRKRNIPISIMRALISYYNSLNSQNSNITTISYKSILILYLCDSIINNPKQVLTIPDLGQIVVDSFASGSPSLPAMNESAMESISNLFIYAMEKNFDFVHQRNVFSLLVKPFATFKPSPPNDLKKMEIVIKSMSRILKTWPGLLHAGFRLGILDDLVECLPHQPDAVISLFRELLVLEDRPSIWDPYTGLLLYGLTQLGFFNQLHLTAEKSIENERDSNKPSNSTTISSFLNKLLPFVTLDENTSSIVQPTTTQSTATAIAIASSSSKRHDPEAIYVQSSITTKKSMAHTMGDSHSIVKQTSVPQFSSINTNNRYQVVLEVLTVIIPHNEIELKSENTKQFCIDVLNSFKDSIKALRILGGINQQCLIALLQLLVSQENLFEILMNNEEFAEKLKEMCEKVKKNEVGADMFSFHFLAITVLTRSKRGTEYLIKKGIADSLTTLGSTKDNPNAPKVNDEKIARVIIDQIDVIQDISIEKQILISFLDSPNHKIHDIAILKVKSYQSSINSAANHNFDSKSSFSKDVFETVVIPYIEYSKSSEDSINFLVEILNSDSSCLDCAIKYNKLFDSLYKQDLHYAYSFFFSRPESFKKTIVNSKGETVNAAVNELDWWMKDGIRQYVVQYDNSIGKKHVVPPHLFGMLCKTSDGIQLAKDKIPKLVEMLAGEKKLKDKRGALFALAQFGSKSHQEIIKTLQDAKAVETMFQEASRSDSLVFKGSLIVALSMMAPTKYLTNLLDANKCQYFRFGSHMSVVPTSVIDYIGKLKEIKFTPEQFSYKFSDDGEDSKANDKSTKKIVMNENMKKYGFYDKDDQDTLKSIESILKSLLLLICPLTQNQARNELKNLVQQKPQLFERPELFTAVQEILAKFDVSTDNRFMISKLFAKTPLFATSKKYDFDPLAKATMQAKLFTFLETKVPLKTLSKTSVPKYPANQLKKSNVCPNCPEVYLEDSEFESATKKSKDAFYNSLSNDERDKIRKDLLK